MMGTMPLSEEEQRILRQIEEQLQRDPRFSRQQRAPRPQRGGGTWAAVGALVLLAATVLLIGLSPYAAFVTFVLCAACAVSVLRALGGGIGSSAGDFADGLRARFRQP
jgi:cytochrome c oxidase assembly factor CtaG